MVEVSFLPGCCMVLQFSSRRVIALAVLISSVCMPKIGADEKLLTYKKGHFLFDFSFKNIAEGFYQRNGDYLSGSPFDRTFYTRATWDFSSHARAGDIWKSKVTLRSKAVAGSNRLIAVTQETARVVDVDTDRHSHSFNLLVPWFRKAWVKFCLNDAFDIHADSKHYLKFGVFPFELGRGIALGSAYAVTPGPLGFYTDNTIDQYAWGTLFHGDLSNSYNFTYDLYGSILENQCSSLALNTEKVYEKRLCYPTVYRGFGHVNFILAARSLITLMDNKKYGQLTLEPYVMYNHVPEQRVEFPADASSKLATPGFAVEYTGPRFEFGFEMACNLGHQTVHAWDRNYITLQRNGTTAAVEEAYKQVFTDDTLSTHALVTNANRTVVTSDPQLCAAYNGKQIDSSSLYNGASRFRNGYRNAYNGYMFVTDAAYWMKPDVLRVAWTAGYSTGDDHPNISIDLPGDAERDDLFSGFIGLQEIYSGKRVRSLFVLGAQRIIRPLAAPSANIPEDSQRFAPTLSGFTNLIYTGIGLRYTPDNLKRKLTFAPNILYYWLEHRSNAYCLACRGDQTSQALTCPASRALGLEVNALLDVQWLDQLKSFLALGVFVPGRHFEQIVGKPTNAAQLAEVNRACRVDIDYNQYPLVNHKMSFMINFGLECSF